MPRGVPHVDVTFDIDGVRSQQVAHRSEERARKLRAYNLRNPLNDEKLQGKFCEADKKVVEVTVETINWLDANQSAEKEEYEAKQKELEGDPIMQKLFPTLAPPVRKAPRLKIKRHASIV
ncbi:hypothetical protein DYB37_014086 [Aphanomyces astaci]|uniref:Uncharacterized protein n=1 Tax=Aphanomyces astaci TaxID=112090 RepID=A0A3R7A1X1_APHAT|nr:hypothetical protein DYB35_014138 [Aphanomyces astaci]RHZ09409.1 hypothetical protein DYB37_014086 [Aphanomyces astaci]